MILHLTVKFINKATFLQLKWNGLIVFLVVEDFSNSSSLLIEIENNLKAAISKSAMRCYLW